jgi:hypothetical protein
MKSLQPGKRCEKLRAKLTQLNGYAGGKADNDR